jgi:uncharacterized protein
MDKLYGRRVDLEIEYDNVSISTDLRPFLEGWTYTDNLSGAADDLSIRLEDSQGLWSSSWMPKKGAMLKSSMIYKYFSKKLEMKMGQFEVDEIELYSDPSSVVVKGLSVPTSSSFREERTKAWEKTTLKNIATEIAKRHKLKLLFDVAENPDYDRIDQASESDSAFLMRICKDAGLCLKVSNKQLIIFDERKYESYPSKGNIEKGHPSIIKYSGRTSVSGAYRGCRVYYMDPIKRKKIDYTFTPKNAPKTGRILVVNEQVSSLKEAQKLAKNRLREANKDADIFSITFTGFYPYYAGASWDLKKFGEFDGKYIITSATFEQGSGITVTLDLRKCLEGY